MGKGGRLIFGREREGKTDSRLAEVVSALMSIPNDVTTGVTFVICQGGAGFGFEGGVERGSREG